MRHAAALSGRSPSFSIPPGLSARRPRGRMPTSAPATSTARRWSSTSRCCAASTARSPRASATRRSTTRSRPTPRPRWSAALAAMGARFDAASRGEIDLCLSLGVPAAHIAFGNTIKRAADIAHAHAVGVEQFAADAEEELRQDRRARAGRAGDHPHAGRGERGRLAAHPQVRLLAARGAAADGPRPVPRARRRRHLVPRRQPDARAGDVGAGARCRAGLWAEAADRGHRLRILNIGGGFPAFYGQPLPAARGLCRRGACAWCATASAPGSR